MIFKYSRINSCTVNSFLIYFNNREVNILILKFRNGFSLTETLITLGIIGIIAALTLPTLISKYQEKVLVSLAQKNYSVVTNALNMYNADNDSSGNYTALMNADKSDFEIAQDFAKYFNGAKLCIQNNKQTCNFSYKIKYTKARNNGQGENQFATMFPGKGNFILPDGTYISIRRETTKSGTCTFDWVSIEIDSNGNFKKNDDGSYKEVQHTSDRCGRIMVDTNGLKGPNRIGSDVFTYQINENKIYFMESEGDLIYILKNNKIQPYQDYKEGEFRK